MTSTINTPIAHPVTLGYSGYPSPLKITKHGVVDPSGAGYPTVAISGFGTLFNYGTVQAPNLGTGVGLRGGLIVNHGVINGAGGSSDYFGPPSGVFFYRGGELLNYGTVSGGQDVGGCGVKLDLGGVVVNHGLITGDSSGYAGTGVEMYEGGVLINDGTISGGALLEDRGTLIVDPGAVFIGTVNADGGSELELQGTSAARLSGIGSSFSGFSTISFAHGAAWTIEGTATYYGLDAEIAGFSLADTIVVDGFAATSDTFVSGTGLVLSNGTTTETLDIKGSFTGYTFAASAVSGSTTIHLDTFSQSSNQTITATVTSPVQLGINYPAQITIATTGAVKLSASTTAAVSGAGNITNYGVIRGGGDTSITGIGVSLSSGTIDNIGKITGGPGTYAGVGVVLSNGKLLNSGTIIGGVSLTKSRLINSGKIGSGGVTLTSSTMTNSGTVGSESLTTSYLGNTGAIRAGLGSIGVALTGSTFVNTGSLIHTGTLGTFGGTALNLASNGTIASQASNSGVIDADSAGDTKGGIAVRDLGGSLTNAAGGNITGLLGVDLIQGVFTNNGVVTGNTGVYVKGGTLIDAGTINGLGGGATPSLYRFGAGDAVLFGYYGTTPGTLIVDPGAVFDGNVVAYQYKNDVLELSGSSTAPLAGIGTQFQGFRDISFAAGAAWTIAGDTAGLAARQTIAGFTTADTIVLDGFAATSATYVAGVGLKLANATAAATLDITGSFSTGSFMVLNQSGNSVITLADPAAETANRASAAATITITKTLTHAINLGTATYEYTTGVNITKTGAVAPSGTHQRYSYDMGGITGGGDTITNDGTILGYGSGAYSLDGVHLSHASHQNTLLNNGVIRSGEDAFGVVINGGTLNNAGTVAGSDGAYVDGELINSGLIIATQGSNGYGAEVFAGTLINSGTINGGGGSAVGIGDGSTLIVEPGAVFIGAVAGGAPDVLEVAGTSAAELTGIGTSFTDFGTISFASGAAWIIGGDSAGLATGQTILGFDAGDVLLLDSFAASSGTYVGGAGLVLSDGTHAETLGITGPFTNGEFTVAAAGYTTRITVDIPTPSTISGTVTVGVTLGAGGYNSPLTITSTGAIAPAADGANALYAAIGSVTNDGTVTGAAGAANASPAQTGGIGAVLAGATLDNTGLVAGGAGGVGTPGGGRGGVGVSLSSGVLTNSGTITGGAGAFDAGYGGNGGYGLYLSGGSAANSGFIVGGLGGADKNGQTGDAAAAGAIEKAGTLTNTGTLLGGTSNDAVTPGGSGAGLILTGSGHLENHGLIEAGGIGGSAAADFGVNMLDGYISNDGRIVGAASSYAGGIALHLYNGTVVNQSDGGITGGAGGQAGGGGVEITGPGTLQNDGAINPGAGSGPSFGVLLFSGSLMNAGSIGGGLFLDGYVGQSGGLVTNAGSVHGGVFVSAGTLTNLAAGSISGEVIMDRGNSTIGTVINAGRIAGYTAGAGVLIEYGALTNSGSVIGGAHGGDGIDANEADLDNSGVIAAGAARGGPQPSTPGGIGVNVTFISTVSNTGTILGGAGGAYNAGGAGLNLEDATGFNSGLIAGGFGSIGGNAVYLTEATFTNAGTLEAGGGATPGDAARLGVRDTLIADPGAVFAGAVVADADDGNELDLGAGSPAAKGSLDMGGSFSGFGTIVFDVGAAWTLAGTEAELSAGQKIAGFTGPDIILLEGFTATSHDYVAGTGLELSDGVATETLDLLGVFSTSSFMVTDTAAGTKVQLCYLRGTRIATPAGERAIESLSIGDTVVTRFSGYRRIKWIGRQSFGRRFIRGNRDQIPVRIAAGALGDGLPKRDLWISPGHSMLLGDVLVLASSLVNGVTITQADCPAEVHYVQLEFDTHDCVLAEGAWSESFCDYADLRNQFHNVAEFWALYPGHVTPDEHLMCAPRPVSGAALAAALGPIAARAAAGLALGPLQGWVDGLARDRVTGWARDLANADLPVLLEILLRGYPVGVVLACERRPDLVAAGLGHGNSGFSFALTRTRRRDLRAISVRRTADAVALPLAPHCLTVSNAGSRAAINAATPRFCPRSRQTG